jgi:hypothetical protein
MSYENPTALRLGQSGVIDGRRFTVRGRVVMSMVADDGETYTWQEFNLVDDAGSAVTLVWEEAEDGPTWKWFTLYAPREPLTPAEAARKQVGETVMFEGRQIPVTLVDSSTVAFIEGEAPEDVEVGDVAHYFNADAGGRLFVASWGEDYIEFYLGRDLPSGSVEAAFNLLASTRAPQSAFRDDASAFSRGGTIERSSTLLVCAVLIGAAALAAIMGLRGCSSPPTRQKIVVPRLATGAHGVLEGHDYAVAGLAEVEVASPGRRYREDEYLLRDAGGDEALLIQGLPGGPGWIFLRPAKLPEGFTAFDAAALKQGQPFLLGEKSPTVGQLFLATIVRTENADMAARWAASVRYGFVARTGNEVFVCRWSERDLQCYAGTMLPQKDVLAALGTAK